MHAHPVDYTRTASASVSCEPNLPRVQQDLCFLGLGGILGEHFCSLGLLLIVTSERSYTEKRNAERKELKDSEFVIIDMARPKQQS